MPGASDVPALPFETLSRRQAAATRVILQAKQMMLIGDDFLRSAVIFFFVSMVSASPRDMRSECDGFQSRRKQDSRHVERNDRRRVS